MTGNFLKGEFGHSYIARSPVKTLEERLRLSKAMSEDGKYYS